jgi:hypothetical protein
MLFLNEATLIIPIVFHLPFWKMDAKKGVVVANHPCFWQSKTGGVPFLAI